VPVGPLDIEPLHLHVERDALGWGDVHSDTQTKS
jgi:hypothetical protein